MSFDAFHWQSFWYIYICNLVRIFSVVISLCIFFHSQTLATINDLEVEVTIVLSQIKAHSAHQKVWSPINTYATHIKVLAVFVLPCQPELHLRHV